MAKPKVTQSKPIRVTEQAYTRVDEIVAGMQARGLSVNKKSIVSELIMLCPIPETLPQPVTKRARKSVSVVTSAAAG